MIPLHDTIPSRRFPLANWLLVGANTLVFFYQLSLTEEQQQYLFYLLGLVPVRFSQPHWAELNGLPADHFLPFISSMFLHGGWAHFISNMWTLYIFGDNVEDRLGTVRYLLFYLLCGVAASITHYILHIDSTTPAIGASGAISGVMAAYMFLFPHGKIVFMIPVFFLPYLTEISAFFYIGFWFIGQLWSGTFSLMAGSDAVGIAFWAHIGGFMAGAIFYSFFIEKPKIGRSYQKKMYSYKI